ncbi:hypothetical protein FQZ97_1163970 [compost metagenome]
MLKKATRGADFPALQETLQAQGISGEEARAFLHELADTQLLVSELEPNVTGEDFLERILAVLDRESHPAAETLREVGQKLSQLDDQTASHDLYQEITELLRELGEIPDESRLFHTVRVNTCESAANTISHEYQADIMAVRQRHRVFG